MDEPKRFIEVEEGVDAPDLRPKETPMPEPAPAREGMATQISQHIGQHGEVPLLSFDGGVEHRLPPLPNDFGLLNRQFDELLQQQAAQIRLLGRSPLGDPRYHQVTTTVRAHEIRGVNVPTASPPRIQLTVNLHAPELVSNLIYLTHVQERLTEAQFEMLRNHFARQDRTLNPGDTLTFRIEPNAAGPGLIIEFRTAPVPVPSLSESPGAAPQPPPARWGGKGFWSSMVKGVWRGR